MAKKNLASLMSGIMGEPQSNKIERGESTDQPAVTHEATPDFTQQSSIESVAPQPVETPVCVEQEEETPAAEVTPVSAAQEKPRRRRAVGRPRKGEERVKSDEIRATFIVDPEVVRKVKYISLVEGNLLKEVIDEALIAYIASWEAVNGRIPLPRKKN